MKLKNRKGSTLALTIMIFAVLMIFATFVLNFMVTENKQAINHQNKTKAYYIARSGAEAVETAVLTIYNDADNSDEVDFFNKIIVDRTIDMDGINIDGSEAYVTLVLEDKAGDANNFILNIISTSTIGKTNNTVHKVLNIPSPTIKTVLSSSAPITYVNNINKNISDINDYRAADGQDPLAVKDTEGYPLFEFIPTSFPTGIKYDILPLSGNATGNYYVENLNGSQLKNLTFNSPVNIYVKNIYSINASTDLTINGTGDAKNLNIYAYGGASISGASGKTIIQLANLFVPFGQVDIAAHKLEQKGNIVLGDNVSLNVNVDDNGSVGHANIDGMIYGPKSVINIGDSKKGALSVEGSIIGYDVNFLYKVNNLKSLKLTVDNSGGVQNPIELEEDVVTTIQKGLYK